MDKLEEYAKQIDPDAALEMRETSPYLNCIRLILHGNLDGVRYIVENEPDLTTFLNPHDV